MTNQAKDAVLLELQMLRSDIEAFSAGQNANRQLLLEIYRTLKRRRAEYLRWTRGFEE